MSYKLDPKILSKLRAFAARRRKLIIIRGVCTAVAMLLATMMIVAFIDLIFILPDGVRWGLSAVAYLAVIIAEWRTCLTLLTHAPGPRRLARLVEHAEPKLREDLLSAVELGTDKGGEVVDSEQFRALVQSDVAARMDQVDVDRLLPVGLVRRYLGVAAVIFAAMIVAFVMTGTQFGTLLMRALLPMANFARVSKFHVAIVEPKPAEMPVPFGDAVPLIVKITGGRTNKAVLEIFTRTGGREVVRMTPADDDQFSATIQVAREDVQYRVRAGDAITRKYTLGARPRPFITAFEKTYTFPDYAKMEPKHVSEENGDVAALEGSEVELKLQPNQKIKSAELTIDQGRAETTVPLVPGVGNLLTAKISFKNSGTYRVHLVAAESGFENKFSPEYEIRAVPDLVPQVELDSPKDDLILPANEIVDLEGTATDDQSLAKVSQLIRVNEGGWKEVKLVENPGAKTAVERRWDLFEQGVKPGDLLTTKLLAVDLKGNRSESRSLQITITASGFESKRMTALEPQRALLAAIGEMRVAAEALDKQSAESRDAIGRLPEGDPQRKQIVLTASAAMQAFDAKMAAVWPQLTAAIRASSPGHQSANLVLLSRLLSRVDAASADFARDSLGLVAGSSSSPFVSDQMRRFAASSGQAANRARIAHDFYKYMVGAEELDVLAENMAAVSNEQDRLAALARNSGDDKAKWAQIANRIRVIIAETRSLEGLMTSTAEHLGGSFPDRIRNLSKQIEKPRSAIDAAITAGTLDKNLNDPTAKLAKACAEAARSVLGFEKEQAWEPAKRVTEAIKEAGPAYANFDRLREDIQQAKSNDKLPADEAARLVSRRWDEWSSAFKTYGDAEESRPDSDTYFVNDVRTLSLALKATHDAAPDDAALKEKLAALEKNLRLLESGHNIFEVADGLRQLAAAERWEIRNGRARTSSPRDWSWLESRLRAIPEELGKAAQDDETRKLMSQAQEVLWKGMNTAAPKQVSGEMAQRHVGARDPVSAREDVEKVAMIANQALAVFRKPMQAAREELAQMVPKLSELAAQLAKETEDLKKETQEAAQKPAEQAPAEAQAEAQKTLAKQEKLNAEVGALKDALRADANQQDMAQKEGRERARDADDALAMLKEPPVKAEQALMEAAQAPDATQRKEAQTGATEHQQKLADALNQLAEHYANVEQGKAEESRTAMRETEKENGVKEQLDAQFAKAEQMAELAQKSPEELLAQLEKALTKNPEMQKELSEISKDTLADAKQQLDQASKQENQVAKDLAKLTAQANPDGSQPTPQQAAAKAQDAAKKSLDAAKNAQKAADEAVQSAKVANNQPAADQARQARADAQQAVQAAEQAAQSAAQAAEKMTQPNEMANAANAAQAAAEKSGEAAKQAEQAAGDAAKAQATAQQTAQQKTGDEQAKNQATSKEANEAQQAAQQAAQAAKDAQAASQQVAAMAQNPQAPQMAQQTSNTPPNSPAGAKPQGAQNPQLAQAANQQPQIAQTANEAGEQVARAGRHEERLQNNAVGEQLQELGAAVKETAMQQVPSAQQALAKAQKAAEAQAAVNAADSQLAAQAAQLGAAANPTTPQDAAAQPPSPASAQTAAQTPPQGAQSPQTGAATPPSQGQPAGQQTPPMQAQAGSPQGTPPPTGSPEGLMADVPTTPPTPQEQVWMARTLDALDAALHSGADANAQKGDQQANAQGQPPGQQGKGEQPGQPSQDAAQAQAAMAAAAQAAAQAMRAERSENSETPVALLAKGDLQAKSKAGVKADGTGTAYGKIGELNGLTKTGDWGKLPKQIAEELSQGQRETVAGEYRNQIETYYRVIAEKSKK